MRELPAGERRHRGAGDRVRDGRLRQPARAGPVEWVCGRGVRRRQPDLAARVHDAVPGAVGARHGPERVPQLEGREGGRGWEKLAGVRRRQVREHAAGAAHREWGWSEGVTRRQPNQDEGICVPAQSDQGEEVPETVGAGRVGERARRPVHQGDDQDAADAGECLLSAHRLLRGKWL